MLKHLTSTALAVVLVGAGGGLALAVSGNPDIGGNAAVSQYGQVPSTPPSGGGVLPEGDHGVQGTHDVEGKSQRGGAGNPGGSGNSDVVETASSGPVAAAS